MPPKMHSIFYLGPGRIEMREVPIPQPARGELVVRVRTALTCGTDVKTYLHGHPKFPPPTPFGHEFAGEVTAIGEGVDAFAEGQRVTANVFAPCGSCFYCRIGQANLCEAMVYNLGAFAEYLLIPAPIVRHNTFVLSDSISDERAAILEPLVSVVHGQRRIEIKPGETVLILGAGGPIGLMHLQLARLAGAAQVLAVDLSDTRLALTARLGAHAALNPSRDDVRAAVMDATSGRGADAVIECAGTAETWQGAVDFVRKGGRVLWFGGLPGETTLSLVANRMIERELTLLGIHGGTPEDALHAFQLLRSGVLRLEELISDHMPLCETELALQRMQRGEVVKIALLP
jgi:L-iditol 2-dehydrogenase